MNLISNSFRGTGISPGEMLQKGEIETNAGFARELFARCPVADCSPLIDVPELAGLLGVARLSIKDERQRMGLGSFKALGAAFAIAKSAEARVAQDPDLPFERALKGQTYVCASAGNHGLSMAAGARLFGADAVVYLAASVPEEFALRLGDKGAKVVRHGETYEQSMAAAMKTASENSWQLLSDSSWLGYADPARDVMEGYLIMGDEVATQLDQPPTHIFLQAGVGGLAAACAASARNHWGDTPVIVVVEPEFAPALFDSIEVGRAVTCTGPVSAMGRLDCKEPSHLALHYLAREADHFMTLSEDEAAAGVAMLSEHGIDTSPSGAAGFAGLLAMGANHQALNLDEKSRLLVYVTEAAIDVPA